MKVIVSKSAFNRYLFLRQYNCQQELNSLSPEQNEDPVNLKSNLISPERAFFFLNLSFPFLSLSAQGRRFSITWSCCAPPANGIFSARLAPGTGLPGARWWSVVSPSVEALHCTLALQRATIALESSGCKSALDGEGSGGSEGKSLGLSWVRGKRQART